MKEFKYERYKLSNFMKKKENENNTPFRIFCRNTGQPRSSWHDCFGLFRGLPIIPNRSCPDYDERK